MNTTFKLAGLVAAGLAITAMITPAEARIRCKGRYQIVQGRLHATPYCENTYLAHIAQQYGMRVSSRAVRDNIHVKQEVCRTVGYDNRVRDICAGLMSHGRGGGIWY